MQALEIKELKHRLGHWAEEALFYHVYPLGMCGAPAWAGDETGCVGRLEQLYAWIPYWQELGVDAILLGPIFASGSHGYDTSDFFHIDPRLGDANGFAGLVAALHRGGIKVVLDGVFNHVGRDFWAFRDVCADPEGSPYRDWFHLSTGRSADGDPFAYACWEGHQNLVRLNHGQAQVREHLLAAVSHWISDFGIDGLRLDVAYCLDPDFLTALAAHCRGLKPDFWLMGEIIHGDYRPLLSKLDSVTNYECHKGLWSSHKDRNCFEIAHSLQRHFGPGGISKGRALFNFADNHDVDRVASRLPDPAQLFSLYLLLLTMPGVPSLYYGSELGLTGSKAQSDDAPLRPPLAIDDAVAAAQRSSLFAWISKLAAIRRRLPALQSGAYQELAIRSEQFAFARETADSVCIAAINLSGQPASLRLDRMPQGQAYGLWRDLLEPAFVCEPAAGLNLPPHGGRILVPAG